MNAGSVVAAAFALDLCVGDPVWSPHPVRAMGWCIARGERAARARGGTSAAAEARAGAVLASALVTGSAIAAFGAVRVADRCDSTFARGAMRTIVAASTIATRDLLVEGAAVEAALEAGDLGLARSRVARIVGRDTAALDAGGVARATIETLAESTCDGIVAPLCALALGGVPLAFAFKAASTLDSTIGHIESPYTHFGRFAARLDDAFCYVPARVTALLICALAPLVGGNGARAWSTLRRDGASHRSPNAGRCEAAMAGALGVRLGGPSTYDGVPVAGALLGAEFDVPDVAGVRRARTLARAVAVAAAMLATAFAWLRDGG